MSRHRRTPRPGAGAFTLIELLIVIFIIALVSAVTLPTILPALNHREVSEAARIFQGALIGIRDAAIRARAPRGLRLLPDPVLTNPTVANSNPLAASPIFPGSITLAYNRLVPIEPAPDYSDGRVTIGPQYPAGSGAFSSLPPYPDSMTPAPVLLLEQSVYQGGYFVGALGPIPNAPTNWYWNIRVGDKIRIGDSGIYYTVVGPMMYGPAQGNPEQFVNIGLPGSASTLSRTHYNVLATASPPTATVVTMSNPEYLFVVNGQDDDLDGYVDEGWDGIDQDLMNGVDDAVFVAPGPGTPAMFGEWENGEKWLGSLASALTIDSGGGSNSPSGIPGWVGQILQSGTTPPQDLPYAIFRRPVVSQGAREVMLPPGVVIDATTWLTTVERSRLPIDPTTLYVDIMLNPSGEVIPTTTYSSPALFSLNQTFYHFWLTERQDVFEPLPLGNNPDYLLPMPQGTNNYPHINDTSGRQLKGDRRLITLFSRNGMLETHTIENFDGKNLNLPFFEAQLGAKEEQ